MADKNLDLSLRITADLKQARAEVDQFKESLNKIDSSSTGAQLNSQLEVTQDELQKTGQMFTYAGKSAFTLRDSFVTTASGARETSRTYNEQTQTLEQLVSKYDAATIAAKRLAEDERRVKVAFAEGKISAEQYNRVMGVIQKQNLQLAGSFRNMRGLAQNFGYQLQDIAVQAQAGVNPSIILAQQGSQLVSVFNPLAGAAIAVAGALGGALLPTLFSNDDAAEKLAQTIGELHKSYETLHDEQRQFKIDQETNKQKAIRESMAETDKELEKLTRRYEALKEAQQAPKSNQPGVATFGQGSGGSGFVATLEDVTAAEQDLNRVRASRVTQNDQLAESENEIKRLNGEKVIDERENIKNANELIAKLKEQVETYGLAGGALGEYIANSINASEANREQIVALYKQIEAQKAATKAEAEAAAERDKAAREAETKQRSAEEFVKSIERQAVANTQNRKTVNELTLAEKGLTGELLARAQAAQQLIDQAKEKQTLDSLELQLLRAQGSKQEAAKLEFKQRYDKFLDELSGDNKEKGKEIVDNLFNLEALRNRLDDAGYIIQGSLSDLAQQENSINVQREAGLISEYEARDRILKLHRETYAELEKQRPLLAELALQPGAVGEAASKALADLDAQAQRLQSTTSLLVSTIKSGLESGLTDALTGLADGTKSFGDAIRSVGSAVAAALAQMAAQALAQQAVGALFGAAGGAAGGGAGGGLLSTFASFFADGGHVSGPGTGTSDSIPAWLSNNEYVTRSAVVQQPGALDFLHDFNTHGMSALDAWTRVRHSTGGLAGVPAPSMPSPTLGNSSLPSPAAAFSATVQNAQNFYLVDDPSRISDALKTPAGKDAVMIMMKNNPGEFRALLNIKN